MATQNSVGRPVTNQALKRNARIVELRKQGLTQAQIGERYEISQSAVSYALRHAADYARLRKNRGISVKPKSKAKASQAPSVAA